MTATAAAPLPPAEVHAVPTSDGTEVRLTRYKFGTKGPIVMAPGYEGFLHYHDTQDELYFVHSGTALFEVEGEQRELGPGSLVHVESTTPRKFSNAGDDDLVVLVVGGKDGYVERDGHLVDPERDLARRQAFGS